MAVAMIGFALINMAICIWDMFIEFAEEDEGVVFLAADTDEGVADIFEVLGMAEVFVVKDGVLVPLVLRDIF